MNAKKRNQFLEAVGTNDLEYIKSELESRSSYYFSDNYLIRSCNQEVFLKNDEESDCKLPNTGYNGLGFLKPNDKEAKNTNNGSKTILMVVAVMGDLEMNKIMMGYLQKLPNSESFINFQDHTGYTALMYAIRFSNVEIANQLIQNGALINLNVVGSKKNDHEYHKDRNSRDIIEYMIRYFNDNNQDILVNFDLFEEQYRVLKHKSNLEQKIGYSIHPKIHSILPIVKI